MDSTNELKDIAFEEEEEENEDEKQETDSQNTASIDRGITIDYYKKLVETLTKRINKTKEKLNHYRKIQLQFSMLLNKTVENQYGAIVDEAPIQKQAVPPLPPIHKQSRTEIIRLIHSATPSEVSSYFNKSNVISLLLFSDTSVFDNRLKESLMHSSPDVQVSFFNSTFQQIKKCGDFINQLIPLLSKFSTDSLLRSQIISTKSNFKDFYRNYYLKLLQSISKLINFPAIKIIYATSDSGSLIYPTENFIQVINYSNSVCSHLFKKKVTQMNSPQKNPSFEIVSEGPVFEDYKNVLSVKFSLEINKTSQAAGVVIILSDDPFKDVDETILCVIVSYLSPLLKLLRTLFLRMSPSNFSKLTRSVCMLRKSTSIASAFPSHLCCACGAAACRIVLTCPSPAFPEVPDIAGAPDSSLVMRAAQLGQPVSYINARRQPGFDKASDDAPGLPRIASMLVCPVRGSEFVCALYNSVEASEFTPVQRAMADALCASLRPLLARVEGERVEAKMGAQRARDEAGLERTIEVIPAVIRSCLEGRLFECLANICPSNGFLLFEKISDNEMMRFPGSELVEVSDNLARPGFFFETDTFDLNIDAAGDASVRRMLVATSKKGGAVITTREGSFAEEDASFFRRLSCLLLAVVPFFSLGISLAQCKLSHQLLRDSLRMSATSFSRLISAPVRLLLFEKPLQSDPDVRGAPLVVSIETARGIEGALVAYDSSSEVRAAAISYAEWLTAALSMKARPAAGGGACAAIGEALAGLGALDAFKCSAEDLNGWVRRVLPLLPPTAGGMHESLSFVGEVMREDAWRELFGANDALLVALAAFLRGIQKKWECKSDRKTVKILSPSTSPGALPALAAVFASGFGIASALADDARASLASRMALFVASCSAADECRVLARVRSIAMRGFAPGRGCARWLGAAVASLARLHEFARGEAGGGKAELFVCERVLLPVAGFLSARSEKVKKVGEAARERIVQARKAMR